MLGFLFCFGYVFFGWNSYAIDWISETILWLLFWYWILNASWFVLNPFYSQICFLLAKSFYTGFSLTVLALLARLRVLVQQVSIFEPMSASFNIQIYAINVIMLMGNLLITFSDIWMWCGLVYIYMCVYMWICDMNQLSAVCLWMCAPSVCLYWCVSICMCFVCMPMYVDMSMYLCMLLYIMYYFIMSLCSLGNSVYSMI